MKTMIKNLLNADEEPPSGTKVLIEETTAVVPETRPSFEIPENAKFFVKPEETPENSPLDEDAESLAALRSEIESLEPEDRERLEKEIENTVKLETIAEEKIEAQPTELEKAAETPVEQSADVVQTHFDDSALKVSEEPTEKALADLPETSIFQSAEKPPSTAETIRQSGLAYSAAIVLFGSVIFTMLLGWFADLLLGSSPWGIVGGIILGGIIGFIQFFRITSQIFKK